MKLVGAYALLLCIVRAEAFFQLSRPTRALNAATGGVVKIKGDLLDFAGKVDRGITEKEGDREAILNLIKQLEAQNPTSRPNTSPLLTARWRLVYTTSNSILGKTRLPPFRPKGPIYQFIDVGKLRARNEEVLQPVPFLPGLEEAIEAKLTPEGDKRVKVNFDKIILGPLSFNFNNENYLDITYLDKDLRISRGGRGNVFVLVRDD